MTDGSELDLRPETAKALSWQGCELASQGDLEGGSLLLQKSLAIKRALGDTRGVALELGNLGTIALQRREFTQARTYLEECLTLFREVESPRDMAVAFYNLGRAAVGHEDYVAAHQFLVERLRLCQQMQEMKFVPITLAVYAQVARAWGKASQGALLAGAYEALTTVVDTQFLEGEEQEDHHRNLAALRSLLGEEAFAAAYAQGQTLTCEQAITIVMNASPPE